VQASQQNWTHGCAATPGEARTLAIVEALERYSGIAPPRHERIASYDEVRDEALDPTTLPLFSEAQYRRPGFRFERFEAGRALRWVRGFSLTRGAPRYVPASAAHYGEADTLVEETSSGMAAHTARRPALLSALSELLERDAFMIHWLNRLSPPIVDVEGSGDARVTPFLEFVKRRGWEPRVLDLTTDLGFPVYLATGVREDGRGAALLVGAGASLDPAWAMLRALRELYSAVVAQAETFTPPPPLRAEEVERMQQHIDFYQDPKNLSRAAFLWASSRRAPAPKPGSAAAGDPSDPLTEAVRRLSTHGLELIGVDVTAPDVARHGLVVVRALVPGLQPLAFGRSYLRLGGRRLYEAPQRMGHRAAPTTEAELNPDPHCFP
jgi:ribosomal protein S12 methylthiotransferase accessory factor